LHSDGFIFISPAPNFDGLNTRGKLTSAKADKEIKLPNTAKPNNGNNFIFIISALL
jgi:hypothetical protein